MADLEGLSNAQIKDAANLVGELWWDARGLEALAVLEYVRKHESQALSALLEDKVKLSPEQEADIYRQSLIAILESKDAEAKSWVERAVRIVRKPKAQVIDPFLGGALLIFASCIGVSTIILASRVKSAGGAKFDKGVPKEVTKVVKAAMYAPVEIVKSLKAKMSAGE
jgi:hypothetical protein